MKVVISDKLFMENHNYCVIMAGGVGSRFWPMSRSSNPKQFLDILGVGKTLIQQTFERFNEIIPVENIYIVSNREYFEIIKEQLPLLPEENILLEPNRRNTAPCIAYAAYRIKKKDPEALMVVAPSDHLILKEQKFLKVVDQAFQFVNENDSLLTLGILPRRPETGYGYIQVEQNNIVECAGAKINSVKTFTEKPDLKLAKVFMESGEFFWNSGIFFWSLKSILKAFKSYLPEINQAFSEGIALYETSKEEKYIEDTYAECKNISIDYGIMEKAENVYVLTAEFGWSDLGTWGSLYEQGQKDKNNNMINAGNTFLYDTKESVVSAQGEKLIVLQGLENFIVVDSDDVLLVCKKDQEQRIKNFVNDIKLEKGGSLI